MPLSARSLLIAVVFLSVGVVAGFLAAGWLSDDPDAEYEAAVQRGHDLATLMCARCHAVADEPQSPREGAPPFRTIMGRLTAEGLDDELSEGLVAGHDPMPRWLLSTRQIDDLFFYIDSISVQGS